MGITSCDLDLWPKVTKFNRVRASAGSNHLAKTSSKLVHPFGWNFFHKKCWTHTQTNWSENITPLRFCGGVKKNKQKQKTQKLFFFHPKSLLTQNLSSSITVGTAQIDFFFFISARNLVYIISDNMQLNIQIVHI